MHARLVLRGRLLEDASHLVTLNDIPCFIPAVPLLVVGLHTPMQRQLRAYPYAYTLLPLYYISTSLSHWLSWPLGSNRLWASVARTLKVGDWESSWLFWTLPDHPQARIQLFRRLDGADRI